MKIVIWIIHILLSIGMLIPGIMKLITPFSEMMTQMPWVEEFSEMQVRIIALLEILGVIGLNLPYLLKKFKKLIPLASLGLSLTMAGATILHITRSEPFIFPVILMILGLLLTYFRKDLFKA